MKTHGDSHWVCVDGMYHSRQILGLIRMLLVNICTTVSDTGLRFSQQTLFFIVGGWGGGGMCSDSLKLQLQRTFH